MYIPGKALAYLKQISGISLIYLSRIPGLFPAYPRLYLILYLKLFSGLSKEYLRHIWDIFHLHLRHIISNYVSNFSQAYISHSSGISQVYHQHISGKYQTYLRYFLGYISNVSQVLSDVALAYLSKLSDKSWVNLRRISGIFCFSNKKLNTYFVEYLRHVWNLPPSYLKHFYYRQLTGIS